MSTIYDVNGNPIELAWIAEFAGFFMADGSLSITHYTRHGKNRKDEAVYNYRFYRPEVGINQRADNEPLLRAIADRLGGHITGHHTTLSITHANGALYPCKPRISWRCVGKAGVQRIVDMLQTTILPYRGLTDKLTIMQEYLDLIPDPGKKVSGASKDRIAALWDAMRIANLYKIKS